VTSIQYRASSIEYRISNIMSSKLAIQTRNLGKCYRIYEKPIDRLKQSFWRGRKQFFREFWAVKNISINIEPKETVGIVGSNGSGKSTLLQLICNILTPTVGEVQVRGRVSALLELGSGFNPEFTGRENININAAIMGLSPGEIRDRFEEIVNFADIGDFIDQPVKTYSSGMYVRLAFASAINVSPDILLVDEALSVGDIRFQQKCMAKMKSFCKNGTVLFVSHNTSAILEFCSRAIWIEGGKIRMDGSPKRVAEKYLEYMYEGEPSRDISVDVAEREDRDQGRSSDTDLFEDLQPVTRGIRNFGNRNVDILRVGIRSNNETAGAVYSGKPCEIALIFETHQDIANPIVGFLIKDRMGRDIIGDNTALLRKNLPSLSRGIIYKTSFMIGNWPNIFGGEYTLSVGVADGRLEDHVACRWVHDVIAFESIPLRSPAGIFSILDMDVEFKRMDS